MQRTIRSVSIVIVTVVIGVGYRLGVAVAAPPAASDACTLLTKQDAAAALGETVQGPESKSGLPMGPGITISTCEYTGSGSHRVQLEVFNMTPDSLEMSRGLCAQQDKTGLAGLGDLACWSGDKHGELHVFKGKSFISVELHKTGDPTEAIKPWRKKCWGGCNELGSNTMKRFAIAVCLVALAASARAQIAPGTWIKRSGTPGMIMIVESVGSGLKLTYRMIGADGKPMSQYVMTVVTMLDGKDAAVLVDGKRGDETMAVKRIDASHTFTVMKMQGKEFGTSKMEVSGDGKVLKVENNTAAMRGSRRKSLRNTGTSSNGLIRSSRSPWRPAGAASSLLRRAAMRSGR